MRRTQRAAWIALALAVSLWGCARRTEQATTTNTSDSLLAANPVEPPQGDISPQTDYQNQTSPPPTKTPAPARRNPSRSTPTRRTPSQSAPAPDPGVTIPAGTGVKVAVNTKISSETANPGDTWSGTVTDNVIVGSRVVIPAGSVVTGTVTSATPAKKGSRASVDLAVQSIEVDGRSYAIAANTESIVAGSTRARNLGAVAGGAVAGAILGRAVGGSGKGAVVGGLLGGAAAGGAVAASKGYQVVIKEGTQITFNTRDTEHVANR